MTRRRTTRPENDTGLKALVEAGTPVVTVVGKTWDFHVTNVLGTTLEENLKMIARLARVLQVGRAAKCSTTRSTSSTATGRTRSTPSRRCKRRGGSRGECGRSSATPTAARCRSRSRRWSSIVKRELSCEVGIHCHNDCELAVANSPRRGARRGDAGAGHHQRHRRAVRQRRP